MTNGGYVPEQHTDFVFSAVGEQFGLLGTMVVLLLFGLLGFRIFRTAQLAGDLLGHAARRGRARAAGVARLPEHRHDDGDHAGHGNSRAPALVRRLEHRGVPAGRRPGAERPHAPVRASRPASRVASGTSSPRQRATSRYLKRGGAASGKVAGKRQLTSCSQVEENRRADSEATLRRLALDMTLWPRLEPLLAKVQKPARYIGCEDGALTPEHGPGKVAWLLVYPDAYEIGLPNQGLQILYEILNERDDAVAERSYAPWVDLEALLREHRLPLFSVDTHRPADDFDLIAFNLSAELVYTNVLNCIDLAGVPVRAAERGPEHPIICAGGHCAFNPEPLADFVDVFVLGDGEEVVSEITEVIREWKAGGRTPGSRERVLRELATVPGVYVPSMYEVAYDGRGAGVGHAALPRRARAGREAHGGRPRRLALPEAPARAAHRGRARPAERRGVPGLHPRLPLLPGGHDHPPGPGASRGAGAHDGPRRSPPHGLRRGDAHLALDGRLQRHRAGGGRHGERPDRVRAGEREPPVAAGRCLHRRHRGPGVARPAAPASRSRPRPARGGCGR